MFKLVTLHSCWFVNFFFLYMWKFVYLWSRTYYYVLLCVRIPNHWILSVKFLLIWWQEIRPFETKAIMRASFIGRVESNHTAFIRIRTNKENKQQMLIVPVEVEVTSGQ